MRIAVVSVALVCATVIATEVGAQGTVTPTPNMLTISPSPAQSVYDAAAPANVSAETSTMTLTHTCLNASGNPGCIVRVRAANTNYTVEAMLTNFAAGSGAGSCSRTMALNTWTLLTTATLEIYETNQFQKQCTATLKFRFTQISWTKHTSNGPPGPTNHQQAIEFSVVTNN